MKIPLQIVFRHMESSEALENIIRQRAQKLDKFSGQVIGCRVVVEEPPQHHAHGSPFHVCVYVTVPGDELVVCKDPGNASSHEDAYVAVRDAFSAIERQLSEYTHKRRGKVKHHEASEVRQAEI